MDGEREQMMTRSDAEGLRAAIRDEAARLKRFWNRFWRGFAKPFSSLESMDELLERDKRREEDGFPRKIKFRRMLAGSNKVVSVPYVEEEKLIHGDFVEDFERAAEDVDDFPGHGEGEVGDVIGKIPVLGEGEGEGEPRAGAGPGEHGIEAESYELGKELSEKFELPNLKDKGKKVPTDEYTYDLTDRYRGAGQILDKKATLQSVLKTNLILGRIAKDDIVPSKLIVGPMDKVYRVLSKEKVWKSQAVVFFVRDYSGSMRGKPTEIIVTHHLMIYAWLLVQYEKLVIPRFIVHDTEAKEVSAASYFRESAGGGTFIPSAYKKVNEIVEGEGLERDYNIYVFQGTDGEDYDDGKAAIPEIEKILGYVNRMGVCVLKSQYQNRTTFEEYIMAAGFQERKDIFRMHVMPNAKVSEEDQIKALKALISQD